MADASASASDSTDTIAKQAASSTAAAMTPVDVALATTAESSAAPAAQTAAANGTSSGGAGDDGSAQSLDTTATAASGANATDASPRDGGANQEGVTETEPMAEEEGGSLEAESVVATDTAAVPEAAQADAHSPVKQQAAEKQSEGNVDATDKEKGDTQPAEHEAAAESATEAAAAAAEKRKGVDAPDATQSDETRAPKKQKTEENNAVKEEVSATVAAPAASLKDEAQVPANALATPIMISRDDMAKMEEDDGLVKFDVITNDGTPEHLIQLTTLKNIFARQLPKMPKEYIVRLVFDRNHRSMVILKNGTHVIGGICYRPFLPNHFAEIAFCAINAADQVKGYGTRLMNHLKEFVKQEGITHFLTYADNYAIGYFKKQGFAKVVSMPRANWFGYIKDYDGGTLMECTIHSQIDYLRITSMVHKQRKAIQDRIKERSRAHIVYPGLEKFAEGRLMDIYMIPGVKEAGWSPATIRNSRIGTRDPGSLKTQLTQLWKAVSSHRSAWPFHEPVDTTIVVDYLEFIKEPVDLSLIAKRIESGQYTSKMALRADLDLMCNNCMIYNTPDTNYYKAAKDLQEFIERRIQVRDGPSAKP